jgi:phenylpyruvate tautomerase PptA (4-oxalocrotonate tautomerase family)
MPATLIEVRRQYSQEQEIAIIEAVHSALVSSFKIPVVDKTIRLIAHEPHRMSYSPNLTYPELFTLVSIDAFLGRSVDAKRSLYKAIVENLEPLGIPKNHVKILLRELPTENWGLRGGQAGCDIEFDFKIEV